MKAPTYRYHYTQEHTKYNTVSKQPLPIDYLSQQDNAGHADHWALLGVNNETLRVWLPHFLAKAVAPKSLMGDQTQHDFLLIGTNDACHVKQVFALDHNKPSAMINVFPALNSPYGVMCTLQKATVCTATQDAILCLDANGTTIYAFDQLYGINKDAYFANDKYYVNLSAWAYDLTLSDQSQSIVVTDPKAIRYHRAFNDIVARNDGQIPKDIDMQIRSWQPDDTVELGPVEITMGHSCIYLFGETFGQEDEAWCQGQVLGISDTQLFDKQIKLFDVAILRERDKPLVIRIACIKNALNDTIAVYDYIQSNIWLQAAIYPQNQHT